MNPGQIDIPDFRSHILQRLAVQQVVIDIERAQRRELAWNADIVRLYGDVAGDPGRGRARLDKRNRDRIGIRKQSVGGDAADTVRDRLRRNRGSSARLMATFSKGTVQIDRILQRSLPTAT